VIDYHILTPLAFSKEKTKCFFLRGFHAVKKNRFTVFFGVLPKEKLSLFLDVRITCGHPVPFFPKGKEPSTHRSRKGEDTRLKWASNGLIFYREEKTFKTVRITF